jgi:hypothetical protein
VHTWLAKAKPSSNNPAHLVSRSQTIHVNEHACPRSPSQHRQYNASYPPTCIAMTMYLRSVQRAHHSETSLRTDHSYLEQINPPPATRLITSTPAPIRPRTIRVLVVHARSVLSSPCYIQRPNPCGPCLNRFVFSIDFEDRQASFHFIPLSSVSQTDLGGHRAQLPGTASKPAELPVRSSFSLVSSSVTR